MHTHTRMRVGDLALATTRNSSSSTRVRSFCDEFNIGCTQRRHLDSVLGLVPALRHSLETLTPPTHAVTLQVCNVFILRARLPIVSCWVLQALLQCYGLCSKHTAFSFTRLHIHCQDNIGVRVCRISDDPKLAFCWSIDGSPWFKR